LGNGCITNHFRVRETRTESATLKVVRFLCLLPHASFNNLANMPFYVKALHECLNKESTYESFDNGSCNRPYCVSVRTCYGRG
jgi:hypothetical protein